MHKNKFKYNKKLKYKIALVMLSSFGFGYLLWYSYYTHIDNVKDEDLPLIQAPSNIISRPKDRGGMIIPNKDKDIYLHMSGRREKNDRVNTAKLNESNISKSQALALLNKQLKNRKIKRVNSAENDSNNRSFFSKLFVKYYYLRVAKLTNPKVKDKALKILQNKYSDLRDFNGKLYEERNKNGKDKYYLHIGPVNDKKSAVTLCDKLMNAGKACKVVEE